MTQTKCSCPKKLVWISFLDTILQSRSLCRVQLMYLSKFSRDKSSTSLYVLVALKPQLKAAVCVGPFSSWNMVAAGTICQTILLLSEWRKQRLRAFLFIIRHFIIVMKRPFMQSIQGDYKGAPESHHLVVHGITKTWIKLIGNHMSSRSMLSIFKDSRQHVFIVWQIVLNPTFTCLFSFIALLKYCFLYCIVESAFLLTSYR